MCSQRRQPGKGSHPCEPPDWPLVGRHDIHGGAAVVGAERATRKKDGQGSGGEPSHINSPPMMPVPMEWRALAPAPVAIASGSTSRMNARDVMMIGRRRSSPALMVASMIDNPC
jgi:hypothetical protein